MLNLDFLRAILLMVLVSGCAQAIQNRNDLIDRVRPLNDKALELLVQETWESPVPCWFPNPTWQRRIARLGPEERDRFLKSCDPMNLTMEPPDASD